MKHAVESSTTPRNNKPPWPTGSTEVKVQHRCGRKNEQHFVPGSVLLYDAIYFMVQHSRTVWSIMLCNLYRTVQRLYFFFFFDSSSSSKKAE